MAAYKNFIGGDWVESISGRRYPVFNPARRTESVGEFQTSTAEDATVAVEAARAALPGWANTPAPGRASVLFRALEIHGAAGRRDSPDHHHRRGQAHWRRNWRGSSGR